MFKVKVTGFKGVTAQFASANEKTKEIIEQEFTSMAKDWVAGAKRDAPKNMGGAGLAGGISYYISGSNTAHGSSGGVVIVSNAFYSAFMEFGTKGKYLPIPGTENIAAQFKGYKGTGSIYDAIRKWVKQKGIGATLTASGKPSKSKSSLAAQETAIFLIARSILRYGVNPHPFFFKQQDIVWPQMVRRVKQRIEQGQKVTVIMPGDIMRPKIITI